MENENVRIEESDSKLKNLLLYNEEEQAKEKFNANDEHELKPRQGILSLKNPKLLENKKEVLAEELKVELFESQESSFLPGDAWEGCETVKKQPFSSGDVAERISTNSVENDITCLEIDSQDLIQSQESTVPSTQAAVLSKLQDLKSLETGGIGHLGLQTNSQSDEFLKKTIVEILALQESTTLGIPQSFIDARPMEKDINDLLREGGSDETDQEFLAEYETTSNLEAQMEETIDERPVEIESNGRKQVEQIPIISTDVPIFTTNPSSQPNPSNPINPSSPSNPSNPLNQPNPPATVFNTAKENYFKDKTLLLYVTLTQLAIWIVWALAFAICFVSVSYFWRTINCICMFISFLSCFYFLIVSFYLKPEDRPELKIKSKKINLQHLSIAMIILMLIYSAFSINYFVLNRNMLNNESQIIFN